MRVKCPCGTLLKHTGDPNPDFADMTPNLWSEGYLDALESAIEGHEPSVAIQWVAIAGADFSRRMCQCPSCGRLFIQDEHYQPHEFLPANESVRKDWLSRPGTPGPPRDRREPGQEEKGSSKEQNAAG
jgi:hypothetical protein